MERLLFYKLICWKNGQNRKPLLLRGMRQVGKTWILKEFGRREYESVAYFNFERNKALGQIFQRDLEPERLLRELSLNWGEEIHPQRTLIFLDEIQFCKEAITSLKYFCEEAPEYHIVCAGSLLGIALSEPASYPVGKVEVMTLHPMSFFEFLRGCGEERLAIHLDESVCSPQPVATIFAEKLSELFWTYLITGGMPEAVKVWADTRDFSRVDQVQDNILQLYALDFAKNAPATDIPKLSMIWESIPGQLAKENGKFIYGRLRTGASARAFENALTWLQSAGMAHKVYRIEKPAVPLSAYVDPGYFKLYASDVGLLRKLSGLTPGSVLKKDLYFQEFRGVLTENYVLQELIVMTGSVPFYWNSGNQAEVDFVVPLEDRIVPIEVKASENKRAKSLTVYREKYRPQLCVKANTMNLSQNGEVLNLPLYLFWKLQDLAKAIQLLSK